jgi:hypothetical protein
VVHYSVSEIPLLESKQVNKVVIKKTTDMESEQMGL